MAQEFEVIFRYKVDNTEGYETNDPEEMAQIDLEAIREGELDISDLFDDHGLDTVNVRPCPASPVPPKGS